MPKNPRKPTRYPYSFAVLPGNANSPIILLGPVIGDTVDHCMFYLPREKVIVTGDCMYGRTTHVWAAEIETPAFLEAWRNIVDLIEGLDVERIIPGHLESAAGLDLDASADLEHNRKYLDLFATKITYAEKKPKPAEIEEAFKQAFAQCSVSCGSPRVLRTLALTALLRAQTSNDGFFLGFLGKCHGEGGEGARATRPVLPARLFDPRRVSHSQAGPRTRTTRSASARSPTWSRSWSGPRQSWRRRSEAMPSLILCVLCPCRALCSPSRSRFRVAAGAQVVEEAGERERRARARGRARVGGR